VTEDENTIRQFLTNSEVPCRHFLTAEQTAQELNVSGHQIRSLLLLKTGQLRGIQVTAASGGSVDRHPETHRRGRHQNPIRIASEGIDVAGTDQERVGTNGRH